MATLCIASCGKTKIWKKEPNAGPTKAELVYVGPYASKCIQYAKHFYSPAWCILSAKHGFLLPSDIVSEDYNVSFKDKNSKEHITLDKLKQQVSEKHLDRFDKIAIIAGKEYADIASKAFPNATILRPHKNCGGNMKQAKAMTRALELDVPLE